MKRAAIVVLALAALVLLGSLPALLPDASSCHAAISNATSGPGAIVPEDGGRVEPGSSAGGNGQGGGSDQGDADGLSGYGGGGKFVMFQEFSAPGETVDRVFVLAGMWWKLMIWIR